MMIATGILMMGMTALAAYLKGKKTTKMTPSVPSVISPQVTGATSASRRRYARMGGRQSTLMTGGLFTNPSLTRQGLKV